MNRQMSVLVSTIKNMDSLIYANNFYKRIVNFINVAILQLGCTVSLKRCVNSITNIVFPEGNVSTTVLSILET